jgi:hypothetical protein
MLGGRKLGDKQIVALRYYVVKRRLTGDYPHVR